MQLYQELAKIDMGSTLLLATVTNLNVLYFIALRMEYSKDNNQRRLPMKDGINKILYDLSFSYEIIFASNFFLEIEFNIINSKL